MDQHKLQHLFKEAIVQQDVSELLIEEVKAGGKLSALKAIEIYQDGYPARLSEALLSTYEATARAMGEEGFLGYALQYIYRYPSRYYDLNQYGKGLSKYLRSLSELENDFPYIGDLSQFEWLFKEVFDDPRPVKHKAQPKVFSGETVLQFDSSLRFFQSQYSVYLFWKSKHLSQEKIQQMDFSEPENLIIYKSKEGHIQVDSISSLEYEILKCLAQGQTIGDSLDRYSQITQDKATELFKKIALSDFYLGVKAQS